MGYKLNDLGDYPTCTALPTRNYFLVSFKKEDISPLGRNVLGVCIENATMSSPT